MKHIPDAGNCSSRAAVFLGPGLPLEICDFVNPELGAHEALAAIECCTVCGSDLHTVKGVRQERVPTILGHESIGRVVAMGNPAPRAIDGSEVLIGERITWSTSVSCLSCDRCRSGLPQKCRTLSKYGHELAEGRWALSGGLAEHIVLRAGSAIAKVSETLPAEIASPANCATSTVACALRYAGPVQGQRVLIFGAGMLGLTAAAMCDAAAAAGVTVVDTQPDRLALARRFGATQMVQWNGASKFIDNGLSETRQASLYDVVMEFSGTADGVAAALQHADIGARVLLVGTVMPTACVAMDPEQVVRRCLSIRGIHNYAPEDLLTAVRFLEHTRGRYPFDELVAKHFSLSDVNAAIDYAIQFRPVRIAVRP